MPERARTTRTRTEKIVIAAARPEVPDVLRRAGEQVEENRALSWFAAWFQVREPQG